MASSSAPSPPPVNSLADDPSLSSPLSPPPPPSAQNKASSSPAMASSSAPSPPPANSLADDPSLSSPLSPRPSTQSSSRAMANSSAPSPPVNRDQGSPPSAQRWAYCLPAMVCCCASSPPSGNGDQRSMEEDIIFEKRCSKLPSIYVDEPTSIDVDEPAKDPAYNIAHRVTLEDWSKLCEASERQLGRKRANGTSDLSDLYQILGLFFVFQGVILTAIAQANLLRCHNWILPFILSLLTSIAAFGASLQKLYKVSESDAQVLLEEAQYKSLNKSIELLKEQGRGFDLCGGQPDLKGRYTKRELSGKGCWDNLYSSFNRFCSVWILSYAGAYLLVLSLFSGVTLFSIHQILCNPG